VGLPRFDDFTTPKKTQKGEAILSKKQRENKKKKWVGNLILSPSPRRGWQNKEKRGNITSLWGVIKHEKEIPGTGGELTTDCSTMGEKHWGSLKKGKIEKCGGRDLGGKVS